MLDGSDNEQEDLLGEMTDVEKLKLVIAKSKFDTFQHALESKRFPLLDIHLLCMPNNIARSSKQLASGATRITDFESWQLN